MKGQFILGWQMTLCHEMHVAHYLVLAPPNFRPSDTWDSSLIRQPLYDIINYTHRMHERLRVISFKYQ